MNGSRRSIPFHVTLLTLMVLIVLPLAAALLWLGWRAVDQLEERSIRHRMAALDSAVEGFLTTGLSVVVAVGSTLAETQAFAPGSTVADEERLRQFAVIISRYPAMAAIYVGYEGGRFLYVGRTETLSISQRLEFDAPDAPSLLMRSVEAGEGMRRETWWFQLADGGRTPFQTRMVDFDPRTRPWYVDAMRAKGAVLTEPYSFAQTNVIGVSAGMPLREGGVIGFDFTLNTLSRLIGDYRFTPNSIIMVASDTGTVFMESEICRPADTTCLPREDEVRAAMRAAIARAVGSGELQPGDLVFFNTMRRSFSHVGIYIGDNKFVHSPSTGSTIRVDDMDNSYWEKRYTGARRVEATFPIDGVDLRQRVSATIGNNDN